ncbi:MAG: arginine--tRNA ligase [Patescibacteria group bacterium]|nr:arginine--tRNA ligase [Patescibacteria group bacterium]
MTNQITKTKSQGVKLAHTGGVQKASQSSILGVKPLKTLPPKEFVSFQIITAIYEAVKKVYPNADLKLEDIQLENPVEQSHGDYATNIALKLKTQNSKLKTKSQNQQPINPESPRKIAEKIVEELKKYSSSEARSLKGNSRFLTSNNKFSDIVDKIEIAGPGFINFWLSEKYLLQNLDRIEKTNKLYGTSKWGTGKKWSIEHTSPNPNKALHLGHLRNNVTGMAIANSWEFIGINTTRDCIDNDRGIAIAKLMWGFLKFARKDDKQVVDINYWYEHQGEWQTPEERKMRVDRFVDELYTLGAQDFEKDKEVETQVRQLVVDWENEDKINRELWRKVLSYSYYGQEQTLKRLGNKWDKVWHEHEHYKTGKSLVEKGMKLGIFRKTSEGTILTDLKKFGLSDTVVIKSDGTALYITQDLALTKLKKDTFRADKLHWVIGPEQSLDLKQMFAVCQQLGIGKVEDYIHIAYGYMSIKGQGKMSSRLGNGV